MDSDQTSLSAVNKEDYDDPTGELLEKTTYLLRFVLEPAIFCLTPHGVACYYLSNLRNF